MVLLAVFAVPSFVPALHELFEHHDHKHCTAKDVKHWHQGEIKCQLCDYLLSIKPFHSDQIVRSEPILPPMWQAETPVYIYVEPGLSLQPLRGPPVC